MGNAIARNPNWTAWLLQGRVKLIKFDVTAWVNLVLGDGLLSLFHLTLSRLYISNITVVVRRMLVGNEVAACHSRRKI